MQPDNRELSSRIVTAVESMPAFPASVHNILRLTSDMACPPKELVDVIERDPVVTVKVLRVVNSAYYCLPRPITSLAHALVFLGFNGIKNLALGIAAVGMLPAKAVAGFDGHQYLLHSLTTAGAARQLAPRFTGADPHAFYIAGLLHDFGKVVIAQVLPEQFRKALEYSAWNDTSLHRGLMAVASLDHADVGAHLLEKWHFPSSLVEAIRFQHDVGPEPADGVACVYAANRISRQLGVDFGGAPVPEVFSPVVAQRLGATLDDILQPLDAWAPLVQEARRFAMV
jgi:putative nucleotidyltransferase with HDIG domain